MYYPDKKKYIERSEKYNLIPVFKQFVVDTETPTTIFMKTGGSDRQMFLLESIEGSRRLARYSFIGVESSKIVKYSKKIFSVEKDGVAAVKLKTCFPLKELEKVMEGYYIYPDPELNHFTGGAVGYLGYDLVRYFEDIKIPGSTLGIPEMMLFLTDTIIVFDHLLHTVKIISTVRTDKHMSPDKAYRISTDCIDSLEEKIFKQPEPLFKKSSRIFAGGINGDAVDMSDIKSNFSKEDFLYTVEKAKKHINSGDVFQLVLSQRFEFENHACPFDIYRVLRILNPSPYMYYLNFDDLKIIGSSPEPLIKITGRKILTCPIAGTRKRGKNQSEDEKLISSLLNDEKEKAEHNMLVDLSRNDLGRVCRYGSVKLKRYMGIEKYSHVMHMVSRVEGTLRRDKTIYDALAGTFPAGTLTGAPKIRAMQLISEFEPDRRGPYGGIIGYFGYDRNLDSCITIRTALLKDAMAYVQAGAGIVYDSIPENEWDETFNKAAALLKTIKIAGSMGQ